MVAITREASDAADGHVPTTMAKRKAGDAAEGDMPIAMAKRRAGDGDDVGDTSTPLPLSQKNLALLNFLNGDTNDNDSDSDSAYLFESNNSDTMNKKKGTLSTTTSGFQQKAYENGILDPTTSKPPQDLGTLQHHLTSRRNSTQPSESTHQRYRRDISRSFNEPTGSYIIQSEIIKNNRSLHYTNTNSQAITQVPKQDFNKGLSDPLPDHLEGIWTESLPGHLRNHSLHRNKDSLAFCHFAAEFKRPDGNFCQAVYQAAYDGAILVNARDRALDQARVQVLDDAATAAAAIDKAAEETAVFTCATDGKTAKVFAHHYENGQYHQNLVAHESLLSYPNRGRDLIRNTQDYARKKSYELAALMGADLKEEEEEEEKQEKEEVKGWGQFWSF